MDGEIKAIIDGIQAEDTRQNHRLEKLEDEVKSFHSIAMSVERLAINMENMLKEQAKQGERLDKIESAPVVEIKKAKSTALNTTITVIISAILGALISRFFIG